MNLESFKKRFMKLTVYEVSEPEDSVALPHFY